jgi:DNA-binding MarR family transcriptional regulator
MMKIKGKQKAYRVRLMDNKHPYQLKYKFSGTWEEAKKIIQCFGEKQAEYFDFYARAQYYPVVYCGAMQAAADFKYCYEKFELLIRKDFGNEEWITLLEYFEKTRISELYDCMSPNPNLTYLYNLPLYLILKPEISANEFRVLCAFMARSKRVPALGGMKICGWSAEGLGKRIGLHRNSVATCIKKLVSIGYLVFLPQLSNERNKKYKVMI